MKTKELLKGMMLSMMAHPSYQDGTNQEFIDYVSTAKSVLGIEDKIKEEKPLFVTEDGVEVFDKAIKLYALDKKTFESGFVYADFSEINNYHVFFHESNADEYILWNKPLLSLHDIDSTLELYSHELDELRQLAMDILKSYDF